VLLGDKISKSEKKGFPVANEEEKQPLGKPPYNKILYIPWSA